MLFKQLTDSWLSMPYHHDWLEKESRRLMAFYRNSKHPKGGFGALDIHGNLPVDAQPESMLTARMTHCFSIASLQGEPGAGDLAKWGIDALRGVLRDKEFGGWLDGIPEQTPDGRKQAYLHVFVTLAALSATLANIEGAQELLDEAKDIMDNRFWSDKEGRLQESFARDWKDPEAYRGGNSNMHATEMFVQLSDVTGESKWRQRALSIVTHIIHKHAKDNHYLLAEHFDENWQEWHDYNKDKPTDDFRPYGITPGHACEWARLLLHLEAALLRNNEHTPDWLLTDSKGLFETGLRYGWYVDGQPGLVYTHDWDKKPVTHNRLHWTVAESCSTAASLLKRTGDLTYERWYRTLWDYIANYLIDQKNGSWWHELDAENKPSSVVWSGKPDIYHAWQLTLNSRLPLAPTLGTAVKLGLDRL
ncbi:AGE family epimerase/isomerase [Tatumella sp. JGM118]|uniref:AGE family epimerase/isomerase n=1 Tax=Tatumella terrea TaxID=419007 RepID=A0ABW1VVY5_9GAMM|nr:AGE family epimerase/isomerase [Tatumella sp. JGM118]MBS0910766.1 AGE family epimerase/isomerase [Tatumella sp. JGM118]